jgi:hypothetical protein
MGNIIVTLRHQCRSSGPFAGSFWKNARTKAALQLPADNHIAGRVDAVELKNRLRDRSMPLTCQ